MESTEKLLGKLIVKLDEEFDNYVKTILKNNPKDIISYAYELTIKQSYIDMLDNDASLDRSTIKALLNKDGLLDYLYDDWMKSDFNLNSYFKEISDDCLDEIKEIYNDFILENYDGEFIQDVCDVLSDLDNYEFCYHLKDKYELGNYDDFSPIIVKEIIDAPDDITYLKEFFNEVKVNEQLLYLVDNHTFDVNEYQKIDDIIIPKLIELEMENKRINDMKNKKNKDNRER